MRQSPRIVAGVLVGVFLTVLAGGAHAADTWNGPPAATPAPPPAGAPGAPGAPPPGYPPGYGPGYAPAYGPSGYPPGFAPYPPSGAGPYGNGAPPAMFMYEAQRKNEFLALAIEFFVPGVGSIYAEHIAGALLTWATSIAGIVLIFWWFGNNIQADQNGTAENGSQDLWAVYLGLALIFGGRIYGLVDSYSSAKDFNRRLRARLGMPEWASLGVVPIRTDRAVAWGPGVTFRF